MVTLVLNHVCWQMRRYRHCNRSISLDCRRSRYSAARKHIRAGHYAALVGIIAARLIEVPALRSFRGLR